MKMINGVGESKFSVTKTRPVTALRAPGCRCTRCDRNSYVLFVGKNGGLCESCKEIMEGKKNGNNRTTV